MLTSVGNESYLVRTWPQVFSDRPIRAVRILRSLLNVMRICLGTVEVSIKPRGLMNKDGYFLRPPY